MPHIHTQPGQYDWCTETFIVHNFNGIFKVLLRKHDKYNLWLGVGGHIELDELPTATVLKEIREEVGLEQVTIIDTYAKQRWMGENQDAYGKHSLITPYGIVTHAIPNLEGHRHIALIYFAISETSDIRPQEQESQNCECRWLTLEEIQRNDLDLMPEILHYASAAIHYAEAHQKVLAA